MTTTRRTTILGLVILAATLVAPDPSVAKSCRVGCQADIASCKASCPSGRGIRRRCRQACRRAVVTACREYPGDACLAPGVTPTTPFHTTTTTTLEPVTSTTTSTTSTTLPSGTPGVQTGFIETVHVTSSGVDRTYSLYVPPTYDPTHTYPVVFAFHGDGGSGASLRAYIGLEAQAGDAAIFVYPDATEESGRHWTLDASLNANADMRFFLDIITQLAATYRIDPRVFATGHSSGGFFVNFLNCTLGSTYLHAIAPHSGSGPYGTDQDYDVNGYFKCTADPAAAILIHGDNDDVVPLNDGDYSHRQWVFENGCWGSTSAVSPWPCVTHDGCDADKPVEWCVVPGIGHNWWSEAPQAIWGFFSKFITPAPGGDVMRVEGPYLYDAMGQWVILRGVNKMNVFDPNDRYGDVSFPEIRATGANTVRIVWMTRTEFFTPTADDLDRVIGNAIANHMIPMIELHDSTGDLAGVPALVDYWTRPDIVAVLRKHERFLLVNIANEAGDWDTTNEEFTAAYLPAIARLRAAGIRSPLVVDAPDSGKNIAVIMDTALQLMAADPEHNLLFSVHIYWAISWGMGADFIWAALGAANTAGIPLVVGEFSRFGAWTANGVSLCAPAGEVDYWAVLQATHYYAIGWYAWEWGPGNGYYDAACSIMDMTTDSRRATLQPGWATDVVSGPYGITMTSVTPISLR